MSNTHHPQKEPAEGKGKDMKKGRLVSIADIGSIPDQDSCKESTELANVSPHRLFMKEGLKMRWWGCALHAINHL